MNLVVTALMGLSRYATGGKSYIKCQTKKEHTDMYTYVNDKVRVRPQISRISSITNPHTFLFRGLNKKGKREGKGKEREKNKSEQRVERYIFLLGE